MTTRASGSFDVKVVPVAAPESAGGIAIGRVAGTLTIRIVEKQHFYDFDDTLPE